MLDRRRLSLALPAADGATAHESAGRGGITELLGYTRLEDTFQSPLLLRLLLAFERFRHGSLLGALLLHALHLPERRRVLEHIRQNHKLDLKNIKAI